MSDLMNVSSNPHIRSKVTTGMIMYCVIIALMPATVFGVYNFGIYSLALVAVTVVSAIVTELVFELIFKKKITIGDGSAVVTGLLLALNLPPKAPLWIGIIGAVFAIFVVKMLFGGLGQNFMNPALGARCFLLISFPAIMTNFETGIEAYSGATPLARLNAGEAVNVLDMVLGRTSGTIGETSVIAIVIGACLLILLGIIDLKIPGMYIVSFAIFIGLFGGHGFNGYYIAAELAAGGLMLGAFFMATDYVTRPITLKGQLLYGVLLGILTGAFRVFGSGEGVSYAIIIGNLCVPLIEKITVPKAFGEGGERI
ncbi:MAG: RnfABCDGE type electron transport complex subunit D [Lachnospiraceae bacterium]|nr:RnfABCDGE type electron transport complex subunit D [Lachnospiraceae bacterium]